MKTTIQETEGFLTAYLEGELDTAASIQAEKDFKPLLDCEGRTIVMDCSNLTYIASSGLRLFLTILKNSKAKGSKMIVQNINEDIRKVFTLTGFFNLFDIR